MGHERPAARIDEVVSRLAAIDASLAPADGVACFNRLYLAVTRAIAAASAGVQFEDVPFLEALDVTFANLYFAAHDAVLAGEPCPRAWSPVFEHRDRRDVSALQFALAGMNAHINNDLPHAVVQTARVRHVEPFGDTPYERDFERVNAVLATVEATIKTSFQSATLAAIDRELGDADDNLALWSIHHARAAAWESAKLLWQLERLPHLKHAFETTLTRIVDLGGRGLLLR